MARRAWIWLVVLFAAAFSLAYWVTSSWPGLDDAYITYTYARNLGQGHGFVYGPGLGPTYGTTTPLWTLVLTAFVPFGLLPHQVSGVLTSLLFGLTAVLVCLVGWRLDRNPLFGIMAGGLVAGWGRVYFATSGMETALLAALEVGLVLSVIAGSARTERWLPGVLMGLLVLTRPDALLLVGAVVCAWLVQRKWRLLTNAAAAGAVYLPWAIYAALAFGDVVPASLRAKMASVGPSGHLNLHSGLWMYVTGYPKALIAALGGLALVGAYLLVRQERRLLPIVLWVPLYYLALWKGGAPDFTWYYVPPLWVVALAVARSLSSGASGLRASGRLSAVFAAVIVAGFFVSQVRSVHWTFERRHDFLFFHANLGEALNGIARPGDTVAAMEVGNLAYRTNCRILDMLALTFPEGRRWAESDDYEGFIHDLQPDYAVLHAQEEMAEREHYSIVWERVFPLSGNMYRIWRREGLPQNGRDSRVEIRGEGPG